MTTERFEDYYEFIYLNTKMTSNEALNFARQCWNCGLTKYEAIAKANA